MIFSEPQISWLTLPVLKCTYYLPTCTGISLHVLQNTYAFIYKKMYYSEFPAM